MVFSMLIAKIWIKILPTLSLASEGIYGAKFYHFHYVVLSFAVQLLQNNNTLGYNASVQRFWS